MLFDLLNQPLFLHFVQILFLEKTGKLSKSLLIVMESLFPSDIAHWFLILILQRRDGLRVHGLRQFLALPSVAVGEGWVSEQVRKS